MSKNGKIQTFSTVRKSLNTHGTLSVYLLCRLLTVSCFEKNRFGEIVNSGSQSNSKVQSTLSALQVDPLFRLFLPFILLGYILIKSENGTQELCLSLYPTHLTRAFLFFLFITFSILNIFCFAGESSRV